MTRREPPDVAVLAARIIRAYPSLSPYSAASLADELCAIERAQRRHAVACCNGDYSRAKTHAELGYAKPGAGSGIPGYVPPPPSHYRAHDPDAEQRAEKRIERRIGRWLYLLVTRSKAREYTIDNVTLWADMHHGEGHAERWTWQRCSIELQDDPRGPVLLLRLPGEAEAVTV